MEKFNGKNSQKHTPVFSTNPNIDRLIIAALGLIVIFGLFYFLYFLPRGKAQEQTRSQVFIDQLGTICSSAIGQEELLPVYSEPVWSYAMSDDPVFPLDYQSLGQMDEWPWDFFLTGWLLDESQNSPVYKARTVACIRRADRIIDTCVFGNANSIYMLEHQIVVSLVDVESGKVVVGEKFISGGDPGDCPGSTSRATSSTDYGISILTKEMLNDWIRQVNTTR